MKMVVGLSIWEIGRGVRGDLIAVSCYFMDTQREEAKLGAHWKCGRQWTQLGTREFLLGLKEKIFPRWGGETLGTRPKRRWDLHLQRYSKAQGSE